MNKTKFFSCFLSLLILGSCEKNPSDIVEKSKTEVAVTVPNLYGMFNGLPTVSTSLSGGNITITLAIPGGSGRTIKEITRVGVSAVTNNYKVVETSAGLYNTAPIMGSGTSVTFTTTLVEYTAKTGQAVTTGGTPTSFLTRYFYFMITLDNGDQLFPTPVRIYVNT